MVPRIVNEIERANINRTKVVGIFLAVRPKILKNNPPEFRQNF
jgi:hypothetical protein